MEGIVKWYNDRKSYGFIDAGDSKDVFVHKSSLPDGMILNEGDRVEFDLEQSPKGPQAVNVKKL